MKKYLIFNIILLLVMFSGYAQKSSLKGNVKTILETKSATGTYSNGDTYVRMVETDQQEYNDKKQKTYRIWTSYYKDKPSKIKKLTFLYDEKNRLISEVIELTKDSIFYTINHFYDADKLVKWSANYVFNGKKVISSKFYFYDSKDKLIQSNYIYIEKDVVTNKILRNWKAENTYNKNEVLIETNWLKSDSTCKYGRHVRVRDENDIFLMEMEFDKNGLLVKTTDIKWEYDSNGNWILKKSYEKDVLINTVYREIEYYD